MFRKHDPAVLVTGAGPVGLFTALQLARRSVDLRIIERERSPTSHSYALALHPASLALLEDAGVDLPRLRDALRVESIVFSDGPHVRAHAKFTDLPVRHPYLLVLRQSLLERILVEELRSYGVSVDWSHRLQSFQPLGDTVKADVEKLDRIATGYPIATSEEEVVREYHWHPRFLVGTDGHRSVVRRRLGIGFPAVGAAQLFGVFEFESTHPVPPEVRVVLHNGTTNVLWPLPDGRVRWSFELTDEPEIFGEDLRHKSRLAVQVGPDAFPHLTVDLLNLLLEERAPWFGTCEGDITWSVLARFERRLAESFGRGRIWLAGDSGHLTGPAGIHSMNVGLREGAELANRIADVEAGTCGLDTFANYSTERRDEWRHLLGLEPDLLPAPTADEWIRENAAGIVSCLPGTGDELRYLAGQLGLALSEATAA
ncbi:MAG: FAD-dependent monooxygenase [bacterium]